MNIKLFEKSSIDKQAQSKIVPLTGLLLVYLLIRSHSGATGWNFTHYLFNYEDGFVKRGFIGELLRLGGLDLTLRLINVISLGLSIAILCGLIFILSQPLRKDASKSGLWIFFLVAITHSATFQHFNYDAGRFDGFCLLLTILTITLITKVPQQVVYITVLVLMSLSVLIHEASFFFYIPFVFAFWFYRDPSTKTLPWKIGVFVILLFITYLVSTEGLLTGKSLEEHYRYLKNTYGNVVAKSSLAVLYRHGTENITYTYRASFNFNRAYEHLLMVSIFIPSGVLVWRVAFPWIKKKHHRIELLLLTLALFSPLLLYPVGIDHFRWWALAITNLFLALSLISEHDPTIRNHISDVVYQNRQLAYLIIILSFIAGPLGVTTSFPDICGLERLLSKN